MMKTRDRLEETANIGGLALVLVDSAGLRDSNDSIEREGIVRAEASIKQCDLAILVLDASDGVTDGDRAVVQKLADTPSDRLVVVLNKCDALVRDAVERVLIDARLAADAADVIPVSALTGSGVPELERRLLELALGDDAGTTLLLESVTITNARHREALDAALLSLREAERTTEAELPGDFIAIDVRGAVDALGLITGETVTDDIVHRIFKDFCVGK